MKISPEALETAHLIDRLDRLARSSEQVGDLNPAQWEALRYLASANRFSRNPAALADYLISTRGTVSRTLSSLETKGYISRADSKRDGRSVEFSLSGKGERVLRSDPIIQLAEDIERAGGTDVGALREALRSTLHAALERNQGRTFGICRTCRHFRRGGGTSTRTPHRCALLDVSLSECDSKKICVEQEPVEV
jgi:DNA-binding MarR family transcriptional regulator